MYISENLVYLQMQKTGCTHITKILTELDGGRTVAKHQQLDQRYPKKLVISSVRNPWDWYVSLWAYGASSRGGTRGSLVRGKSLDGLVKDIFAAGASPRKHAKSVYAWSRRNDTNFRVWRELYANNKDPELFRRWLSHFLSQEGKADLPESFSQSSLRQYCGFMTYRFARIGVPKPEWESHEASLSVYEELKSFLEARHMPTEVILMEQLEIDLAKILNQLNFEVSASELLDLNKTNVSDRNNVGFYYDADSINLVAEQERYIIERFGYTPPSVSR